jgi:hypothetical protein
MLDANGAFFFNRQLEHIKAKSYDVLYQDLLYRTLFPVSEEVHPGATQITYETYDHAGKAKVINALSKDLPRVDIAGKETTIPTRRLGDMFAYDYDEIQAAQLTGKPLEQRRANAARRACEELMNEITFTGDADSGIPGLFDNTDVPRADVATGTGGVPWTAKTADEILFDINDMLGDMFALTKQKEKANRILLPTANWNLISSTARSANSDTTILQYVVQNSPFLSSADQIIPVPECTAGGTGGVSIMVAYNYHPDKLQLEIPEDIRFHPVQEVGLEFITPVTAKFAGLNIYYPLSLSFREKL